MKATKRKRESAAGNAARQAGVEAKAPKSAAAKRQAGSVIVLAGNRSVKDAAALKESLCAQSAASEAVTLDVRELERVDTATMQLLCAFVRDRSAQQRSVVWLGESQALQEAARLLGVADLLALAPSGEPGAQRSGAAA